MPTLRSNIKLGCDLACAGDGICGSHLLCSNADTNYYFFAFAKRSATASQLTTFQKAAM